MPYSAGSSNIRAVRANKTLYGRAGKEAEKWGEGRVGTKQEEAGMDMGTYRTPRDGKAQGWEAAVGVGNIHPDPESIREWHGEAAARVA